MLKVTLTKYGGKLCKVFEIKNSLQRGKESLKGILD